ncbi:MAG TPA: hypothetical protein PKL08_18080, partial [Thermoanaerobaculaceae bacterium]|nr:hypothetical protein [Thermoanaerobaculaceae bacterium]
ATELAPPPAAPTTQPAFELPPTEVAPESEAESEPEPAASPSLGEPPAPDAPESTVADAPESDEKIRERDMQLLARLRGNLVSVQIKTNPSLLEVNALKKRVLHTDSCYTVIALKSGYRADMCALNFRDRDLLTASVLSSEEEYRLKYEIVYRKIQDTSVGKISFGDFLRITALADIETLMHGIYCQTYPGANRFNIRCGKCGQSTAVAVTPNMFIEIKDEDQLRVKSWVLTVIQKRLSPSELLAQSLVNKEDRILLPESKIIVDLYTPSCNDYLNSLKHFKAEMQRSRETFGCMSFIKRILMPAGPEGENGIPNQYVEVTDFEKMYEIVCELGNDCDELVTAINARERCLSVGYRIKSTQCTHCGDLTGDVPVSMEDFLDFQIGDRRRRLERGD